MHKTKYRILQVIFDGKEKRGYEIHNELGGSRSGVDYHIGGLLTAEMVGMRTGAREPGQAGLPPVFYSITKAGREACIREGRGVRYDTPPLDVWGMALKFIRWYNKEERSEGDPKISDTPGGKHHIWVQGLVERGAERFMERAFEIMNQKEAGGMANGPWDMVRDTCLYLVNSEIWPDE